MENIEIITLIGSVLLILFFYFIACCIAHGIYTAYDLYEKNDRPTLSVFWPLILFYNILGLIANKVSFKTISYITKSRNKNV